MTFVDAWVQPVVSVCIAPVVTVRVMVCPRSSVRVSVPFFPVSTFILTRTWGPGAKVKLREVPEEEAKYICLVLSANHALSQRHWLVPKLIPWKTPFR